MIEIDPKLYLPPDYLVLWTCAKCGQASETLLSRLESARCPVCGPDSRAKLPSGIPASAEGRGG